MRVQIEYCCRPTLEQVNVSVATIRKSLPGHANNAISARWTCRKTNRCRRVGFAGLRFNTGLPGDTVPSAS